MKAGPIMGLLKLAGVMPTRPGDDSVTDQALRAAFSAAASAHETLRNLISGDPHVAGVICRALGCRHEDDAAAPVIRERVGQIPQVIEQLSEQDIPVLPHAPHDLRHD